MLARIIFSIALFGCAAVPGSAECVPFSEALQHVGSTRCVSGTVLNVQEGSRGVTFLDFCQDFRVCPFTVVIFASDLKHVGDVRQLKGRNVEISGTIKVYDGRAEIILSRPKQLGKDAHLVPPLPKQYDVERHGRYSAGSFSHPGSPAKAKKKKQSPRVPIEDPAETAESLNQ